MSVSIELTPNAADAAVDGNQNNTKYVDSKVEKPLEKDLETGRTNIKSQFDDVNWVRIIAIVIAVAIMIGVCAATWVKAGWRDGLILFAILSSVYIVLFNWKWIWIAIRTAPRDLTALWCYIKILRLSSKFAKKDWSMPDIFHEVVKKNPDKTAFLFEEEVWTYQQVEDFSLRVSAVLKNEGFKPGNTVAVLMNNCPEYVSVWLGIARIGGVSPLINTNQRGNALLHSIKVASCDAVIYGSEFQSAFDDLSKELPSGLKLYKYTRKTQNSIKTTTEISPDDLSAKLENTPPVPWSLSEGSGYNSKLLYIYTSGTTGMPKAAIITSARLMFMASGVHYLGFLKKKDVIYCPMPLYHTAGGCITAGQVLMFGCTVALRVKFSASAYFPDCIKYNATAAHYIGEMCRYVLCTPPSDTDKAHKVRTVYGNGMRPAIWTDFVKRFNIKRVVEFYGATESNANIVNINNKTGAIGFISRIIPAVYPIAILKVDQETGEPIRNKKGLCQVARANEPGVFIGKIRPNNPSRTFLGYADKEASDKKIVRNVFSQGDSAFISGDILISDELGYLYFKDRTGDTFRWRGENVSTTEVEATISKIADQRDAVVYGVEIPGVEGRAGMCGIVDEQNTLDVDKLAKDMTKDLPPYARPVFIRVMVKVDMTGTYKMKKTDLQKEGYNPSLVNDKLFYFDLKLGKYVPLGHEGYQKISKSEIRL